MAVGVFDAGNKIFNSEIWGSGPVQAGIQETGVLALIISFVGGVFPAFRVSRLNIVDALRAS